MSNPFEILDQRLTNIECLLLDIKHGGPMPPLQEIEKPITVKELCDFLRVTEATVIRWRKKGKIPFMTLGSRVMFTKSEVLKALENKKRG